MCSLLSPLSARQAIFALRAFNAELASIKDGSNLRRRAGTMSTATSIALQIRMQWWRDAVAAIYEGDPAQASTSMIDPLAASVSISCWHSPVVRSLYRAHLQCGFTRRFLERLIDARDADLDVAQHRTTQDAIDYAEQSCSSLLYLSLECADVRDDEADIVASHAGVGIGLVTSLRSTPLRVLHGEVPLAADLFPPHFSFDSVPQCLQDEDITALESAEAIVWVEAARQVAAEASVHLSQVQRLQAQVPRGGRFCLLPVVPAFHYLSELQRSGYNVFHPTVRERDPRSRLRLLLLLGRSWLTGVV